MTKPGPPPNNQPSAYEDLTDNRLLNNGAITRMPTNQREWNRFIQELNKWIKNEVGNFDPTFTGFSADPSSASCWWHRYGQIVHLEFVFGTGTSNSTGFNITNLPSIITPRDDTTYLVGGLEDNGAAVTDGTVKIKSDSTIEFYNNPAGLAAWTASGDKGFDTGAGGAEFNSVIYSLRSPEKL